MGGAYCMQTCGNSDTWSHWSWWSERGQGLEAAPAGLVVDEGVVFVPGLLHRGPVVALPVVPHHPEQRRRRPPLLEADRREAGDDRSLRRPGPAPPAISVGLRSTAGVLGPSKPRQASVPSSPEGARRLQGRRCSPDPRNQHICQGSRVPALTSCCCSFTGCFKRKRRRCST